jgi:hypothetical protein
MKNVAILDNEPDCILGIFRFFNYKYANESLNFLTFTNTSQISPEILNTINYIFVDLSLSLKSEHDGLSYSEQLLKLPSHPKIAIITAKSNPELTLDERKLSFLPLFKKPIVLSKDHKKIIEFLEL